MVEHLDSLDDDVLALLRVERDDVPELSSATKDALFASVVTRIGTLPGGGGDGGDGGGGGGSGFALSGGKAIGALLATLALGGVMGAAVNRAFVSQPAPIVVTAPRTATAFSATAVASAAEPASIPVGALPSAPTANVAAVRSTESAATATPPTPSARGLAAERALLDVARGALARGEASEALRATDRHKAEYPSGSLIEEREAIAIKALVALGRRDEAKARLAEMEKRFPNGLMLRAVKSAVENQ